MLRRLVSASVVALLGIAVPSAAAPAATASVPVLDHVVVIVMENRSYNEVIGAPYISSLARQGAVAGSYFAIEHPSLPNYAELTSGQSFPNAGTDCSPGPGCMSSARNLSDSISAAGRTWKAYAESMGSPCNLADSGLYATRHVPFLYYTDISAATCRANVVDYSKLTTDFASASTTPSLAFVTPNLIDDMHDGTVAQGDAWLSRNVPSILATPAFTTQRSALFVVWDEDDGTQNNQVALLAIGSGVSQGYVSATPYTHYSLLRTIEAALGLPALTGNDAAASAMDDLFGNPVAPPPFKGLYTLDGWGGVHPADSAPVATSAYWPWWNIARAAKALPGASAPLSGFVLDGWGGLHPYGASGPSEATNPAGHYWPGWDIARDFAFLPDGTGGVVLDGWGGLHPFRTNGNTGPLSVQQTAYWPGWDIARKVVIFADGSGGLVLDGWGGLHPFGINGAPALAESKIALTGYWPGWNIARDVVLVPGNGGHSGYVLDGWGGLHPFHPTTDRSVLPAAISGGYWPGWDIARGVWLLQGSSTAGYTLDGWGGLTPFGGAPAIKRETYWPNWDIARAVWGS